MIIRIKVDERTHPRMAPFGVELTAYMCDDDGTELWQIGNPVTLRPGSGDNLDVLLPDTDPRRYILIS